MPLEKRDAGLLEKFRQEADGIFLFAVEGLRRLINNHYKFSETETNREELQRYREESDSILSFVKECCELNVLYSTYSTDAFNAYKVYCDEWGLKPCSQKKFVQNIITAFPEVTRGRDSMGGVRTLDGIKVVDFDR